MPFAVSAPWIIDGPNPPVTRLSATELALGCTNRVVSPAPMLNVFQLITARGVVWWIVTFEVPMPAHRRAAADHVGRRADWRAPRRVPSGTSAEVASMT